MDDQEHVEFLNPIKEDEDAARPEDDVEQEDQSHTTPVVPETEVGQGDRRRNSSQETETAVVDKNDSESSYTIHEGKESGDVADKAGNKRRSLTHIEEEFKKINLSNSSISMEESRFHQEFTDISVIGSGGYGKVFKASHSTGSLCCHDNSECAVKRVPLKGLDHDKARREVAILSQLDHRNIVKYHSCWIDNHPVGWLKDKEKQLQMVNDCSSSGGKDSTTTTTSDLSSPRGGASFSHFDVSPRDQVSSSDGGISFEASGGRLQTDDYSTGASSGQAATSTSQSTGDSNSSSSGDRFANHGLSTDSDDLGNIAVADLPETRYSWLETSQRPEADDLPPVQKADTNRNEHAEPAAELCECFLYIKMELCKHGDWKLYDDEHSLRGRLIGEGREDLDQASTYTQLIDAIEYIHNKNIIHRDLKPSNIFFVDEENGTETLKVGDFGLARYSVDEDGTCVDKYSPNQGTSFYISPEMASEEGRYNSMTDIYSLGIIMFEILYPINTERERQDVLKNLTEKQTFPKDIHQHLSPNQVYLIEMMLRPDPNQRPSASVIKRGAVYGEFKNPNTNGYQPTD